MLAETLAADPNLARRLLQQQLIGTLFPVQGGNPGNEWHLYKYNGSEVLGPAQAVELSNGNVGIGTPTPAGVFQILKGAADANHWVNISNNVGTGAGTPPASMNAGLIFGWNPSGGMGEPQILYGPGAGWAPHLQFGQWDGSLRTIEMTLKDGNLGIGTQTPQGILDIAGKTIFLKPGDDVQAAINAVSGSGGGVIYLTAGTYTVGNLTGASNVHLWGSGVGATTVKFTGSSGDMITFAGRSNFSVRNIMWDNNNVANSGILRVIHVTVDGNTPSSNFEISDCSVINVSCGTLSNPNCQTVNSARYGIIIVGSNNFKIERNYVKFSAPSGQIPNQSIATARTGTNEAYNGIINANHCDGSGIQADGRDKNVMNNVVHDFRFGGGITINPHFDINLNIYHNRNNVIVGNTVYKGTGEDTTSWCAGIENWGAYSVISGNVCHDNAGPGVGNGGFRCVVADNVCYNNGANNDPRPDPPQNPGYPGCEIVYGDSNSNASESVYVGNRCFDTRPAGSKTQTYGIGEGGVSPFSRDVTIGINNLLENKNGKTNIQGSNYTMFLPISGGAVALSAPLSVPADSDLNKSNISFYLIEGSTNQLKIKVKYSDGTTIKEGTIALS